MLRVHNKARNSKPVQQNQERQETNEAWHDAGKTHPVKVTHVELVEFSPALQ
jgi:hypothetical protein